MPSYKPDLASHEKQRQLEPKRDELVRVFGERAYRERVNPATGKKEWRVRARGKRQMDRLWEMMRPAWRESAARGQKLEALVPKVRLTDGSTVAEWTAETVCRSSGVREFSRIKRGSGARPDRRVSLRCGHLRWVGPDETSAVCPMGCGAQRVALDG